MQTTEGVFGWNCIRTSKHFLIFCYDNYNNFYFLSIDIYSPETIQEFFCHREGRIKWITFHFQTILLYLRVKSKYYTIRQKIWIVSSKQCCVSCNQCSSGCCWQDEWVTDSLTEITYNFVNYRAKNIIFIKLLRK